jgi:hypothetical protein
MDRNAVYVRTQKGSLEIGNPDAHLPQRMRNLLMLIDGRRPVAQICEILPGVAHMPGIFTALESIGFIQRAPLRQPLRQAA